MAAKISPENHSQKISVATVIKIVELNGTWNHKIQYLQIYSTFFTFCPVNCGWNWFKKLSPGHLPVCRLLGGQGRVRQRLRRHPHGRNLGHRFCKRFLFFFFYVPPEVRPCRSHGMVRPLDRPLTNSPEMKTSFFLKYLVGFQGLDYWVHVSQQNTTYVCR
jgi:hypothetical protein